MRMFKLVKKNRISIQRRSVAGFDPLVVKYRYRSATRIKPASQFPKPRAVPNNQANTYKECIKSCEYNGHWDLHQLLHSSQDYNHFFFQSLIKNNLLHSASNDFINLESNGGCKWNQALCWNILKVNYHNSTESVACVVDQSRCSALRICFSHKFITSDMKTKLSLQVGNGVRSKWQWMKWAYSKSAPHPCRIAAHRSIEQSSVESVRWFACHALCRRNWNYNHVSTEVLFAINNILVKFSRTIMVILDLWKPEHLKKRLQCLYLYPNKWEV